MTVLWCIFAVFAIVSAIGVITRDNPVHSALCLVTTLLSVAAMYAMLNAPFLAIVQVAVYAGAIMVLFLFVIMLLNLGREEGAARGPLPARIAASVLAAFVLVALCATVATVPVRVDPLSGPGSAYMFGSPQDIGRVLFSTDLLLFEVTSLLLTAAMVGAILLARRKF